MRKNIILSILLLLLPTALIAQNLEIPAYSPSEQVIQHTGYTLCYSENHEQAKWVAYELTIEELSGEADRTDNFRQDPKVQTGSASLSDFKYSGYDRGHLAPAADFSWSEEAMSDTFYLSNMSPQKPGFNRGIWRQLESQVREWVYRDKTLFVVTGPVLRGEGYKEIGKNDVDIPRYYYKVLLDFQKPEIKAIGFLLPHKSSDKSLSSFAVTVDTVEERTGIDFYHSLKDTFEEEIEAGYTLSQWFDGKEYAQTNSSDDTEEVKKEDAPAKYWINSGSNTRHNPDCRYYGNTSEGYYTNEEVGEACGICGG